MPLHRGRKKDHNPAAYRSQRCDREAHIRPDRPQAMAVTGRTASS